jgi:hypothetical protein
MEEPKVRYRDGREREYVGLDDLVPDSVFEKIAQFGREYGPEAYNKMSDKEIMEVAKEMGYMVNSAEEARYLLKQLDPEMIRQFQPASMGGKKQAALDRDQLQDIIEGSRLNIVQVKDTPLGIDFVVDTSDKEAVESVVREINMAISNAAAAQYDDPAGSRISVVEATFSSKTAQNNYVAVAKMLEACDKLIANAQELQQQGSMSMPDIISQCEAMKESLMAAMGEMHMMDTPGTGPVPMGEPVMQETPAMAGRNTRLTTAQVREICPSCAAEMQKQGIKSIPASLVYEAKFDSWTDERARKQWNSLGGSEHACAGKMKGKVDNPDAYCSALKDKVTGTTKWRGKGKGGGQYQTRNAVQYAGKKTAQVGADRIISWLQQYGIQPYDTGDSFFKVHASDILQSGLVNMSSYSNPDSPVFVAHALEEKMMQEFGIGGVAGGYSRSVRGDTISYWGMFDKEGSAGKKQKWAYEMPGDVENI